VIPINANDNQLVDQLKNTPRCRLDIQGLAAKWSEIPICQYDSLTSLLTEQQEGKALGILLNLAAVNKISLDPQVWVPTLKVLDDITDFFFPCRFQNEEAIGLLLTMALAEDIPWERQSVAAQLATELTIKFDQSKQQVKKVLWKLSKAIFSPDARALIDCSLYIIEADDSRNSRKFWLSERDIIKFLPRERPAVVIGGDYTVRRPVAKQGRNEPCHCGSGKKYKKCCHGKDQELLRDASRYEGLTQTQLNASPAMVEDTALINDMPLKELQKLAPASLNNAQLDAALNRARFSDSLEFAYELLMELRQRPENSWPASEIMIDLFDSALLQRNLILADKLARQIPEADLYRDEVSKFHHALLRNNEGYVELEALCKKALAEGEKIENHILLELSYAFDTLLPALSVVFGRAAIVSEPQRIFDNEVLFDSIEKNRIELDLEPWGDPIEDYLDWISEKSHDEKLNEDKDRKIETLKQQLTEAHEKSILAVENLRKKELELDSLETELKTVSSKAHTQTSITAPLNRQEPRSVITDNESRHQINALRNKISTLKDEISSQQRGRQDLRKQLQEARQKLAEQKEHDAPLVSTHSADEEISVSKLLPRKIQIPEFSARFRKSAENLPQSVVTKALVAATSYGTHDESVHRQTMALEQLPGYFRVRVGIQHRLILRQGSDNRLLVEDIIPRKNLESWIRKHSA
jgi:hypothetical protein